VALVMVTVSSVQKKMALKMVSSIPSPEKRRHLRETHVQKFDCHKSLGEIMDRVYTTSSNFYSYIWDAAYFLLIIWNAKVLISFPSLAWDVYLVHPTQPTEFGWIQKSYRLKPCPLFQPFWVVFYSAAEVLLFYNPWRSIWEWYFKVYL